MDHGSRPSPRRELQGPRPTPLRLINKDSHKIKKPLVAPAGQQRQQQQPVIIYTVSPKVIHADPSNFMSIVQQLTGADSNNSSSVNRNLTLQTVQETNVQDVPYQHDIDSMLLDREAMNLPPGILSSTPVSLPLIPSSLFTPPAHGELSSPAFMHDFSSSPTFSDHHPYGFLPSSSSNLSAAGSYDFSSSPTFSNHHLYGFLPSSSSNVSAAGSNWDFFNQFKNF